MTSYLDKSPSVLITGATGAIGPLIVKAFHDEGYRIRTLSIDPVPFGFWPNGVETLIGDVTDANVVQMAMEGIDIVIHLAALLHFFNPPPAMQEKYERINVGGTATIVDAAIRSGVRRIVFFSTIAVYGPSDGQILTEDTSPRPETFYARTKLDAEKIVIEAKGADNQALGTILRLGAVYGVRIKGNYQRLLKSLARGHFISLGNGSNRRTLVYDKDVACATILAASHDAAAGKVFNVSDGKFHTLHDIISAICEALGRKEPSLSLPVRPVRFAVGILEDMTQLVGLQSPIVRAAIDKYTEDMAVKSDRIQSELGFMPQYNLKSGWREIVELMRQLGVEIR